MYSIYVSIFAKIKLYIKCLLNLIKKHIQVNSLLTLLTYLAMFIVVLNLINPVRLLISNIFSKMFGKNKESSSHRKYKKINSLLDSCSACGTSSSNSSDSSSKYSSNTNKCKKNKKCKVKLSKRKINKTLQQFKLD